MRQSILLSLLLGLLCGIGIMPARAALTLDATVGFDGYYRPRTLVPVSVRLRNDGPTLKGEVRIVSDEFDRGTDRYRAALTVGKGADQRRILTFLPTRFVRTVRVEFWSQNRRVAYTTFSRCQELYDQDRLLVVLGGTGSSLNFINGLPLSVPGMAKLRPWDYAMYEFLLQQRGTGGRASGNLRLAYVSPTVLPDNPEAYGSVDALALMSTVTDNTLSADVQRALPVWAATGGHLILAGGGVASRLQAPFFTGLLAPRQETPMTLGGYAGHASARIQPFGLGHISTLTFDPDTAGAPAKFFTDLLAREPRQAATLSLRGALSNAVMVRNLKPPNLSFIVLYLLVYLVLLVPVNYFVLRKLDRRELAWITTPAIVLLFTVGAYGVGYATKGRRLVLNVAGVVETVAGQRSAEAISSVLIFSPSRSTYQMRLGDTALLVRDARETPYQEKATHLTVLHAGNEATVQDVRVNMWDFRTFTTVHRVDLGKGVTGTITPGAPGVSPRATGTLTNGTPLTFPYAMVYQDGVQVAAFRCNPGETIDLAKAAQGGVNPVFTPDEQHIYRALADEMQPQFRAPGNPLVRGTVFVGFTAAPLAPIALNRPSTTSAMTAVIVRL